MYLREDVVCCAERQNTAGYTELCVLVDKNPSKTPQPRIHSYNCLYLHGTYFYFSLQTNRVEVYFSAGVRLQVNKRTLKA